MVHCAVKTKDSAVAGAHATLGANARVRSLTDMRGAFGSNGQRYTAGRPHVAIYVCGCKFDQAAVG